MSFFKGSFDLPESGKDGLPENEDAILEKLAVKVVEKGMAVPAILFLESVKPLNFIGSQMMVFFEPIVQTVFNFKDYDTLRTALEKRETVEIMLLKIEKHDAIVHAREKRIKKYMKGIKKDWKWYQRWLGVFRPKVKIPDEIINPPVPDKDKPGDSPSA